MIIDCHGHYTTAPAPLGEYRDAQQAAVEADPAHVGEKGVVAISDDAIRESLEGASSSSSASAAPTSRSSRRVPVGWATTSATPTPAGSGPSIATNWCTACARCTPTTSCRCANFRSRPAAPIDASVVELRRCVEQMGFIGLNLNPDPTGGYWTGPPLGERYWYPLYEAMAELDVPR